MWQQIIKKKCDLNFYMHLNNILWYYSHHMASKNKLKYTVYSNQRIFNHSLDTILSEDHNPLHRTTVVADSVEYIL